MPQVTLKVGGRSHQLACRDGEEGHLQALAAMVDAKAVEAARAVGSANETRQLLLAALLLADELSGAGSRSADMLASSLEQLAERMESIAARLEKPGADA